MGFLRDVTPFSRNLCYGWNMNISEHNPAHTVPPPIVRQSGGARDIRFAGGAEISTIHIDERTLSQLKRLVIGDPNGLSHGQLLHCLVKGPEIRDHDAHTLEDMLELESHEVEEQEAKRDPHFDPEFICRREREEAKRNPIIDPEYWTRRERDRDRRSPSASSSRERSNAPANF